MVEQAQNMAAAFIKSYYETFDSNRSMLAGIYPNEAILTFEGSQCKGQADIIKKLTELPFKTVQHIVTTFDAQPTIDAGLLIHVIGQLKTDDDAPHGFAETFHLKMAPTGSMVVLNQLFRLVLHHA